MHCPYPRGFVNFASEKAHISDESSEQSYFLQTDTHTGHQAEPIHSGFIIGPSKQQPNNCSYHHFLFIDYFYKYGNGKRKKNSKIITCIEIYNLFSAMMLTLEIYIIVVFDYLCPQC